MDEKLRKSLTAIICDIVECTEPLDCDMASTCSYVIDGLPQLEQAFRDADWVEPQQPEKRQMDEKLRNAIITFLQDAYNEGNANRGCVTDTSGELEQAFRDNGWVESQRPAERRIAKMLQSGDRVRLWYGQRFLDWDTISHDWVVMDSQGNKGLGCSLYVGSDLDKALDVLEREGK